MQAVTAKRDHKAGHRCKERNRSYCVAPKPLTRTRERQQQGGISCCQKYIQEPEKRIRRLFLSAETKNVQELRIDKERTQKQADRVLKGSGMA